MKYSPKPLSGPNDARDRARDFGALFGYVLLHTVTSYAHIVVKPLWAPEWTDSTWILSAIDADARETAFQLTDGTWLFAAQTLGVRQSQRDGNLYLTTLRYVYRWQANQGDDSWIIRWDYAREPRGDAAKHPRAHVHVNADPTYFVKVNEAFRDFHIPTGRSGVEDVAAVLIRDHGVPPAADDWEQVITDARETFARILRRLPPQ